MFIVPALLIGSAPATEPQETGAPAAATPSVPAPEARTPDTRTAAPAVVAAKIKELSAKQAATVAAAAYWLGEQGGAAVEAIPQLAAVLGDNRQVNPARYRRPPAARSPRGERSTPGQEAAEALAKIGDPAVEALINVLKTSPSAVARQNAAWALGVIQGRHSTTAVLLPPGNQTTRGEENR